MTGRALHFVFKVADRTLTAKFYRDVLGMKVLRHEEFTEGCEAACNGPYDNRWSKTMMGYGPEDTHFAIELTYNYGVHSYEYGNDFIGIVIKSQEVLARAVANKWPQQKQNGLSVLESPGGYKFFIEDMPQPTDKDPVQKVILASSNIQKTVEYWHDTLKLSLYEETRNNAIFGFNPNQVQLEFRKIDGIVNHAAAYGRIAFSIPEAELPKVEENVLKEDYKVLTPLLKLDTPGKASVTVVILADPDGHEICFVEDENFRLLSEVDPSGEALLDRYIAKDIKRMKEAAK